MGMFGMDMASTFSTDTELTLFFIGWKTNTPAAYFGTLVFLFALTFFTRFLGAWRRQLDLYWMRVAQEEILKRRNSPKKSKQKEIVKQQNDTELEPLSPLAPTCCDGGDSMVGGDFDDQKRKDVPGEPMNTDPNPIYEQDGLPKYRKGWQASNPWTLRIDGPRALMEFVRALIGYIL
ncbi:hypothetical protein BLS_005867 [Venturia inaequalis]|nr:hypothetical protein BLS_005867 [Venturia inaequalis]KAE9990427.1 hypothetical protein EG327_001425 [Venturia inaequalis]RDI86932.1 hypothetical protein Vi05172_g3072 [Venturia inaequalis]